MAQWTEEQKKAIELRDRNILVSAAAGSGKTAVLVERIIQRISAGSSPCNIDELLVVTFTNAAASEMRERVGTAIGQLLLANPSSTHLQRQQSLLHNAQIMTIDSFCLFVIRNYFHCIDLDPAFRIADDAELTLLKSDVISEILEEEYEEGGEDFLEFVECYAGSRTDEVLEEYVVRLYEFSRSYPWPDEWLERAASAFDAENVEELEKLPWIQELWFYLSGILKDAEQKNRRALELCRTPGGPWMYEDALEEDRITLRELQGKTSYSEFSEAMETLSFPVLSRKKDDAVLPELRERVKMLRDSIKDQLTGLKKKFFFQDPEGMLADLEQSAGPVRVLIRLTREFAERFAKRKEEKNLLDFGDMEHFALKILTHKKGDMPEPTQAARELSGQYVEILIDEYQDSNLVQETILNSISRIPDGQPNIFMVGDVKQSIYKFRLARPELFMKKYDSYSIQDSRYQKVDLHKNFRSRAQILAGVNRMFERIMQKSFGGIEYDEEAALYPGASYPEAFALPGETDYRPEIIFLDGEEDEGEAIPEEEKKSVSKKEARQTAEYNKRELEAYAAVKRIRELTGENGLLVTDREGTRRCEYRDIVILLRTMAGWAETFTEVLAAEGIPAYAETQTGYFKTPEVQTMLNLLKILDNPKQDIPFAAVMYSPIAELTSEELAVIRAERRKICLYEAAKEYIASGSEEKVKGKLFEFFELYNELRKEAARLPVSALLHKIYELTGYPYYVLAMPGGEQRKQNLDMLLKRAGAFEATSYHGLFQFIRYIGRLIEYQIDYGEVGGGAGHSNVVRIMSIHKSKGLEFPVVLLCGMGKKFNQSDARAKLVLHPDYGIGPECIDYRERTRVPTLLKRILQQKGSLENLGEELRILYVGMTRAKEKLILLGQVKDPKKQLKIWEEGERGKDGRLLFSELASASSYFDFVGPALTELNETSIRVMTREDLVFEEAKKQWDDEQLRQRLMNPERIPEQQELQEAFLKVLSYRYPFEKEAALPIKTSVSELKRMSMEEEEVEPFVPVPELEEPKLKMEEERKPDAELEPAFEPTVPTFLAEAPGSKAADRGTIYHRVMQHLDYTALAAPMRQKSFNALAREELARLILEKKLTNEEAAAVSVTQLETFLSSDLAARMSRAAVSGHLYRERQFVLGLPACEVKPEYEGNAVLLIQGIIDAYFEEDNGLILVDYKTDRVFREEGEELLKQRYAGQLNQYSKALTRLLKKTVKEKVIYSFSLGKVVPVET